MKRIFISLLFLAGCAGGPLEDAQPLDKPTITETAIKGGETLALSRWVPEGPPRAVILALHGFGDYGPSTFEAAARYWAERGILVYAYDQRGFGRNSSRGKWPGAVRLIADFTEIAKSLRARHDDLPLLALGHSMGGGVALAAVGAGADVDGLILAAPAVWGGENLNIAYRTAAWTGAFIAPEKRWSGKGVVKIQATDNIEALRALGRDEVILRNPSSREFLGLIRLMDAAVNAAPQVAVPTLFLYGAKDQVTPKRPLMATYAALPGEKQLKLYPEGWHLLFRDLQAEVVYRDVADWVETFE
ncbi:MAG: alpha/beta fold hydrolase [Pikeienuella sp.]